MRPRELGASRLMEGDEAEEGGNFGAAAFCSELEGVVAGRSGAGIWRLW